MGPGRTSRAWYFHSPAHGITQWPTLKANNKGADQTARMRRLVCACVVRKPPKTGLLRQGPYHVCRDILAFSKGVLGSI